MFYLINFYPKLLVTDAITIFMNLQTYIVSIGKVRLKVTKKIHSINMFYFDFTNHG